MTVSVVIRISVYTILCTFGGHSVSGFKVTWGGSFWSPPRSQKVEKSQVWVKARYFFHTKSKFISLLWLHLLIKEEQTHLLKIWDKVFQPEVPRRKCDVNRFVFFVPGGSEKSEKKLVKEASHYPNILHVCLFLNKKSFSWIIKLPRNV